MTNDEFEALTYKAAHAERLQRVIERCDALITLANANPEDYAAAGCLQNPSNHELLERLKLALQPLNGSKDSAIGAVTAAAQAAKEYCQGVFNRLTPDARRPL